MLHQEVSCNAFDPQTSGLPLPVPLDKQSPSNWVPMDKWSLSNSVSMDKWSPKIWSPWKNGPKPIWSPYFQIQLGTNHGGPNARGPYVFGTKCVTASRDATICQLLKSVIHWLKKYGRLQLCRNNSFLYLNILEGTSMVLAFFFKIFK